MGVWDIFAGNLSDGRIQLFAIGDDASGNSLIRTCWKTSEDANSGWTDWETFWQGAGPSGPTVGAAARGIAGELQVVAGVNAIGAGGIITGTSIQVRAKETADSSSGWTAWQTLAADVQYGANPVAAVSLNDQRAQVFITSGGPGTQVMTSVQTGPGSWSDFQPLGVPSPPDGVTLSAVAALPDGRLQIWGEVNFIGVMTTWQTAAQSSSWVNWQVFPPPAHSGTLSVAAAAALPDGRIQLWGIGGFSETTNEMSVASCWKTRTDSNAGWTDWEIFPIESFTTNDTTAIAVAPLSDGRLQLWLLVDDTLYSMWKETTDPDSAWTAPSVFPSPQ